MRNGRSAVCLLMFCAHITLSCRPRRYLSCVSYLCALAVSVLLLWGNGAAGTADADVEWLQRLFESTNGSGWLDTQEGGVTHRLCASGWGTSRAWVCGWFGVGCNTQQRVTSLNLSYCNLVGTLPELSSDGALSELTAISMEGNVLTGTLSPTWLRAASSLRRMIMGSNRFTGTLPNQWWSLPNASSFKKIEILALEYNELNGTIPDAIGSVARNMRVLSLNGNKLSGAIPSSLRNLVSLTNLSLSNNQLSGTIPPSIGTLSSLQDVRLFGNRLTGTVLWEGDDGGGLCGLSSLRVLYLFENRLNGTIPSCIGNLQRLIAFMINDNAFSGTLPEAMFGNSSALQFLQLGMNQFSGTLPGASIGLLSQLQLLNVSLNRLTGTIPSTLGSLSGLLLLNMSHNALTGTLPSSLASLHVLMMLDISHNYLTGTFPASWTSGMWWLCVDGNSFCASALASFVGSAAENHTIGLTVRHNCLQSISTASLPSWWIARSRSGSQLLPQRTEESCTADDGNATLSLTPSYAISVAQVATLAIASVASSGAAIGAVMSGGIPLLMQRVTSVLSSASDALYTADPLSFSDSPLQLKVGPPDIDGGAHRGAVLGNIALCVGVLIGWLAACFGYVVVQERERAGSRHRQSAAGALVSRVLNVAAVPGAWLTVVCLPLLQATMLSSVVLLGGGFEADRVRTAAAGWRGFDIGMGLLGALWVVGIVTAVAVRLDPRGGESRGPSRWFHAVYRPTAVVFNSSMPPNRSMLSLRWALATLGDGSELCVWRDVHRGVKPLPRKRNSPSFVSRYGALFDGSRRRRHWWTTCEVCLSVVLAVILALAARFSLTVAASWVVAAVLLAWAGLHVIMTPFRSRSDHVTAALLSALSAIAALLQAASVADDAASALNIATMMVSLLGAIVPAVARVVVLRAVLSATPDATLLHHPSTWSEHTALQLPPLLRRLAVAWLPPRRRQLIADPVDEDESADATRRLLDWIGRRGTRPTRRREVLKKLLDMICAAKRIGEVHCNEIPPASL